MSEDLVTTRWSAPHRSGWLQSLLRYRTSLRQRQKQLARGPGPGRVASLFQMMFTGTARDSQAAAGLLRSQFVSEQAQHLELPRGKRHHFLNPGDDQFKGVLLPRSSHDDPRRFPIG